MHDEHLLLSACRAHSLLVRSVSFLLQIAPQGKQKGELVDPDAFGLDCVTPSTAFMVHLSDDPCFFVHKNPAQDPAWRQPPIIFSADQLMRWVSWWACPLHIPTRAFLLKA